MWGCVLNFILPIIWSFYCLISWGPFQFQVNQFLGRRDRDHFQMRTWSKYIPNSLLIFYTTIIFYSLRNHLYTHPLWLWDFPDLSVCRPTSLIWPHPLNLPTWRSLLVLMCCRALKHSYVSSKIGFSFWNLLSFSFRLSNEAMYNIYIYIYPFFSTCMYDYF